ncbi:cation:dicarboxylase symporter family transporter, partial [Solirubrobacter phytolaccae]
METDLPTLATLAAVALSWVAIWWMRKRALNFSVIALFALAIGIPIGLVAKEHVDAVNPIGRIYINVLLATVAPLVLVAIVSAMTSLGTLAKLKSIGLRSTFWLLLSNALGVILALALAFIFRPGEGADAKLGAVPADTIAAQVQSFGEVLVGFFPSNVVGAFSSNAIIPIILIAVTISIAYLSLAEKQGPKVKLFADGIEAIKLVVFKVVSYVIRLTPYAIVALTAHMVGMSTDLGKSFTSLLGLLVLVWVACMLHTWAINAVILKTFANVSPVAFFRKIFPAQMTAFTTQSSIGTLPVTTGQLTRKVGVHSEIAHFTAPLGANIGMPGCAGIWPIMIAVWGINAYGLAYSPGQYLLLTVLSIVVSIGVAGVPGAATVSAATVMSAAGLPLEFVAATIPIGVIADMARTATNVTAAAVSATVVARQTGMLNDEIFEGRAEYVEEDDQGAPQPAQPQPQPQPVANGWPAQPQRPSYPRPAANGWPAQPPQPVANGWPAQPQRQPVANGWPAQPQRQPVANGWPAQPPQPVANGWPANGRPAQAQPGGNGWPAQPQPVANGWQQQPAANGWHGQQPVTNGRPAQAQSGGNGWPAHSQPVANGGPAQAQSGGNGWPAQPQPVANGWPQHQQPVGNGWPAQPPVANDRPQPQP